MRIKSRPAPPVELRPRPKIEVQWETARHYSYQAQSEVATKSLATHPKGWDLANDGYPVTRQRVPRREGEGDIKLKPDRDKTPLSHLIMEVGPGEVQEQLSYKPMLARPPSDLELRVMRDFGQAVTDAARDSKGRQDPRRGEFVATYSKCTDIETGKPDVVRTAFAYRNGAEIPVPETEAIPDYIIHSHPYDPRDPQAYAPEERLGGDFPSGTDRHLAQDKNDGKPNPKQLMMHGGRTFYIHAGDLHFSLLDPAAPDRRLLADPRKGPGWDRDLYIVDHPTPQSKPGGG